MSILKVILLMKINELNCFYVWHKKFDLDEDFVIFEKPDSISLVFQTKFCLFVNFTTRIVMLGVLLYVQIKNTAD